MQATLVPATPSVIDWAIRESGYSLSALEIMLGVPASEIEGWTKGIHPELPQLQALAKVVKRPFSAFLLPAAPTQPQPSVKFRSSTTANRRPLIPEERGRIREALRLQGILSWIASELGLSAPDVPTSSVKDDPEDVARAIRARLDVPIETQLSWSSPSDALRGWRGAAERLGVTVLTLPMGEESCRGFSIWDDAAPLVAINTAWRPEARVFTLIHELAHLSSRTNSACAEDPVERSTAGDRTERWCDRVAAAVLIPEPELRKTLADIGPTRQGDNLTKVSRIAGRFQVSRRAAALRLIEQKLATWSVFKSIPPIGERLSSGGGGPGRTRAEIRRLQYGDRTMDVFRKALVNDVLGAADVVDYLDVPPDALMTSPPKRAASRED
jgi:Zn-dependent peptidase ImmA (M78 family)